MCLFGLLGIAGLYARQVEKSGWLGLAGYLLFSSLDDAGQTALSFAEAFILPLLATEAPKFVEGLLGMSSRVPSEINLGALPTLWIHVRACICSAACCLASRRSAPASCSRWAGGLLAVGAVLAPMAALLPHPSSSG